MSLAIDVRKLQEYDRIVTDVNHPMHSLCMFVKTDFQSICDRYNIALNDNHRPKGKHFYRDVIWKYFESTVV